MAGPSTGPSSIGMPTMLITRPIRCGPAARARMVCPIGRIMPPPRPCSTRKKMRLLDDHARPQSAEPMMNSVSDVMYIRLAPKRSIAQPVIGMLIASASR